MDGQIDRSLKGTNSPAAVAPLQGACVIGNCVVGFRGKPAPRYAIKFVPFRDRSNFAMDRRVSPYAIEFVPFRDVRFGSDVRFALGGAVVGTGGRIDFVIGTVIRNVVGRVIGDVVNFILTELQIRRSAMPCFAAFCRSQLFVALF